MRQIPGVESAAMGLSLPYERGLNDGFKAIDGPNAGNSAMSSSAYVSPDYFRALRIPVVAGRAFTDDDTAVGAPVAIVNESFARKHLGTRDVVGLHLALGKTVCTIVGLTGDVKKRPGIAGTAPLAGEPVFYIPYTQLDGPPLRIIHTWFEPSWLVRTGGPISGLPNAMQIALGQAESDLHRIGKTGNRPSRSDQPARLEPCMDDSQRRPVQLSIGNIKHRLARQRRGPGDTRSFLHIAGQAHDGAGRAAKSEMQ